jgi:hypothetical protein
MSVETILLPIRHNGVTSTRLLGAMTAIDAPYWFGVQPVMEQRITGLRLIWPDDLSVEDIARDIAAAVDNDVVAVAAAQGTPAPMAAVVFGRAARRYAHLAVIDGGRG